jgi:hypothetical protein
LVELVEVSAEWTMAQKIDQTATSLRTLFIFVRADQEGQAHREECMAAVRWYKSAKALGFTMARMS